MTVSLGARNISLTIEVLDDTGSTLDTVDLSNEVVAWDLTANPVNTSAPNGRVSWTGSITLAYVTTSTISLDPRDTSGSPSGAEIWARGNGVKFQIADTSETLRDFPTTLYIDAAPQPPNLPENTITVSIADTLAVEFYPKPEGDLTGITEGTSTDRKTIVDNIFSSEGLPAVAFGDTVAEYPLTRPIQKSDTGAWVEFAGKLAFTAGYLMWVDNAGDTRLTQLNLDQASPVFTLNVGADEVEFNFRTEGDRAPETLEVRGQGYDTSENTFPRISESFQYTTKGALVEGAGDDQIVSRYERVTETLLGNTVQVQTDIQVPRIIINPDTTAFRFSLASAVDRTERQRYQAGTGRCVDVKVDERLAKGYVNAQLNSTEYDSGDLFDVVPFTDSTEQFFYNATTGQPSRVKTRVDGSRASLGAGLTPSDTFERVQEVDEEWERKSKEQWRFSRNDRRTAQEVYQGDLGGMSPYGLVPDERNSRTIQTNTGEANPPQVRRLPNTFNSSLRQYTGTASFEPIAGRNPRQKKLDTVEVQGPFCVSDAQCSFLASLLGRIRQGRALAAQFTGAIPDWFFDSYFPLARVDVTLGGITTAYLMDGISIAGDVQEVAFSARLIELGTVGASPAIVAPRYQIALATTVLGGSAIAVNQAIQLVGDGITVFGGSAITAQPEAGINSMITFSPMTHSSAIADNTTTVSSSITLPSITHSSDVQDYLALWIKFNGANGSTSFPDSSFYNHSETVAGDAQITTAHSVFGGGSGEFDGVDDAVTYADDASFTVGIGEDFTIEFWVRTEDFSADSGANRCPFSLANTTLSDTKPALLLGTGGTFILSGSADRITGSIVMTTNTWYHVAWVRSSGVHTLYIGGTAEATTWADSGEINPDIIRFGGSVSNTVGSHDGQIDNCKFHNGKAIYTSNFTPPVTE